MRRPTLSKFHLDCVQRARSFANKTFHRLVTLCHHASWDLAVNLLKKHLPISLPTEDVRFVFFFFFFFFYYFFFFNFYVCVCVCVWNGNHEGEQRERCCWGQDQGGG